MAGIDVYALMRDVLDDWPSERVEYREIVAVYRDRIDAECEMQRLEDARKGLKGRRRHVDYSIERVPLYG